VDRPASHFQPDFAGVLRVDPGGYDVRARQESLLARAGASAAGLLAQIRDFGYELKRWTDGTRVARPDLSRQSNLVAVKPGCEVVWAVRNVEAHGLRAGLRQRDF
jgi:hypothetical protein